MCKRILTLDEMNEVSGGAIATYNKETRLWDVTTDDYSYVYCSEPDEYEAAYRAHLYTSWERHVKNIKRKTFEYC